MKAIRRFLGKYINGTRGVISLLLCLVMCPFLTLSFLLVESSRYQQAIETLGEVNNNASMSTLADLDSYLEQRFGLLAESQEGNIDAKYQGYLQKNWGVLGAGATLNSASVDPNSSLNLSDPKVLQQQIMEFSELTVSSELVVDGLDLTDLISTLESIGNFDKITKSCDAISATADVASAAADLIKNTNDILTSLAQYETKYSTYVTAHSEFLSAAMDLQATIKSEMDADPNLCYPKDIPPTPTPSPSGTTPAPQPQKTSVYDNANVQSKITALQEKISAYAAACDDLASNVGDIKDSVEKIIENLNTVQEKIDKLNGLKEEDSSSETAKLSGSTTASANIYQDILDEIESAFVDYDSATAVDALDASVQQLKTVSLNLGNFDMETITGETAEADIEAKFAIITIGVPDKDLLNTALISADDILGGGDDGQSLISIIENMVNSIRGLFEIDGIYDGSLDAYINTDYMTALNAKTGSGTSSAQEILNSISRMLDASDAFKDSLSHWDLLGALKAVVEVLKAVVDFFKAIFDYFKGVCYRIYELVTGSADDFYESMLVCGYCAYDFPSRTNYKNKGGGGLDGEALTGYKYEDISTADSSSSAGGIGSLNALVDLLKNLDSETSEDITFCGAELEYILVGSQSEIVNQASTFVFLYLFRMILNIAPILMNPEVETMAGSATVGAPVVYVLEFILEPLCDTIVLANGGDSYLIKRYVYMTPSGVPKLIEDLLAVTEISEDLQKKILKVGSPSGDTPKKEPGSIKDFVKDGFFKMDYKDHVMFLLMFTCPQETQILPRIQHLIQMESESHYKEEVAGYTFDLKKAYTDLNFTLDVTLEPLFSVGGLSSTGYPYKKSLYRGY